jgi:hypothetical protein
MTPHKWTLAEALRARLEGSGDPFTLHITLTTGWTGEFSLVVCGGDSLEVRALHPEKGWSEDPVFIRHDAIAMVRIEEC